MPVRLFRVLVRVNDIEKAAAFYNAVLGTDGHRVSPGRHHYLCGETELACYDPAADGDAHDTEVTPGTTQFYFAVGDLESSLSRVRSSAGGRVLQEVETKPWGERTFWAADPAGNRLCFVDAHTVAGRRQS